LPSPQATPPIPPGAHQAGGAWQALQAMEVREGDGVVWLRMKQPIIDGAASVSKGSLSPVPGPADWAHGIARPLTEVVADPNPNLTVQLFRQPAGECAAAGQGDPHPPAGLAPASNWLPKAATTVFACFMRVNWIQVNVT
jgi:hypothetical protein